jgi:hypothetical protein
MSWTHVGPLHWFTGCWHRVPWVWDSPGHGLALDYATHDYVDQCCVCNRIKPSYVEY